MIGYKKIVFSMSILSLLDTRAGSGSSKFLRWGWDQFDQITMHTLCLFVCVEVLRPSQPNGVMSSAVNIPNHTFTAGQA